MIPKVNEWDQAVFENFLGGFTRSKESELIEDNALWVAENVIFKDTNVENDTGYKYRYPAAVGTPRRHISHRLNSGVIEELLITDASMFREVSDFWWYVSGGTSTTVSANEAGGQVAISVTSEAGFNTNDAIGIELNTGEMHFAEIVAVNPGVLTIDVAIPSAADAGNQVILGPVFSGVATRHVIIAEVPWGDYVVFTNGIDPVQVYDPAALTCTDITNGYICQTLALYDNSLILANLTEGSTPFPYRIRYSAKGDLTAWTTLEAGFTDVLDVESPFFQLIKLGPFLMGYRDKSIVRIALSTSGLRRFDIDTMVTGVGIFSQLGVLDIDDRHLVWGNDNFYWYSGGYAAEPLEDRLKNYLFGASGNLDEGNRAKAFGVLLEQRNEALFIYQPAVGTDVNAALRYNLEYGNWATRQFADSLAGYGDATSGGSLEWDDLVGDWSAQPNSWAAYSVSGNIKRLTLCSATAGRVLEYDFASIDDAGVAIEGMIETKDFSHPTHQIRVDYVVLAIEGAQVDVDVSLDKGVSWTSLGTIMGSSPPQAARLHRQFVSRTVRFRFTLTPITKIKYFAFVHAYEFEW